MRRVSKRRAVLLDRHPLWLDAVATVVGGLGLDVVGKARSLDDALRLLDEHDPELFVTELDVPGADGVAWLGDVARKAGMRTIVLSNRDDPDAIESALASGATAYVVKTAESEDLAAAVRQTFTHSVYLARSRTGREAVPPKQGESPLTKRELEILRLAADGRSNGEIARTLWVTEQTIKFHLSNIYRKLDVANRTEASRWAHLRGLLKPDRRESDGVEKPRRGAAAIATRAH
jgi:DNA-binding NarL/FixJ family response regulator